MLPSNSRLKKEADFKRIYYRGSRRAGHFFDFFYLGSFKETRFGIVVTTKSIKKASQRNSAKRILRGFLLDNQGLWPKKTDIIIKIKGEIKNKEEAKQELKDILKKI
ncbi:ribonuclease P protein component [Patescibacteria group bacterium]|nr:ribonuclease P protein component [Patescibacteria group bacterium]